MNRKNQLVFAHIGDLHITGAKEQNYIDFLSIVSQIEIECCDKLDFIFLPGDNADNGLPAQYKLVETALKMFHKPVHIIPGDHDMEQGSLNNFYGLHGAEPLPKSFVINGIRCLFLDVCGPGNGGPDFRLGREQLKWLDKQAAASKTNGEELLIFTHTYPDDLKNEDEKDTLNRLLAENEVLLVDMGHTHYNELANDGNTIFSATRSTGQIEEGPVGYSIITVDNSIISWRFKQLQDPFPFVMITSPADYRLSRKNAQLPAKLVEVRAIVFGNRPIKSVACQVEDGPWFNMQLLNRINTWSVFAEIPSKETTMISVQAIDESGRPGVHSIRIGIPLNKNVIPYNQGSDAASIGAWPGNGIPGTQLGPNRNAKPFK